MDCLIKREFWRVDGRRNGEVLLNGAYDSEYIVVDLKIYNRSTPTLNTDGIAKSFGS